MKTVVITGSSKGIGLAINHKLASLDYKVIGIARNMPQDYPGAFFTCDLASVKDTEIILQKIKEQFQIDVIVNNVGIALPEPLEIVSIENLTKVFDINVRVALQTVQTFLPNMKKNHYGKIVNIASRAIFGVKNRSSYAAAKSALVGLTRTWALELAEFNINVNAVAPGPIDTELFRKTRPIGSIEEQNVLRDIPLKRIGKPNDIANMVAFLISDDSSYVTGQTMCVDGGGSL